MDVNSFGAERKVIVQRNSPIIFNSDNTGIIYGDELYSGLIEHDDDDESLEEYFIEEVPEEEQSYIPVPQSIVSTSQLIRKATASSQLLKQATNSPRGLQIGKTNIVPLKTRQQIISNQATSLPGWPVGTSIKVLSNEKISPVLRKIEKTQILKKQQKIVTYTQQPETYHIITNDKNKSNSGEQDFQLEYQNEGNRYDYSGQFYEGESLIVEEMVCDEEPAVEDEYPEEYLEEYVEQPPKVREESRAMRTKREQQEAEIEAMRQHIAHTSSLMKRSQHIEELDIDYFSIWGSDFLKWRDGVGYMRDSGLHFEFNSFGMIDVMDDHDYYRHVKTDVNESLVEPVQERTILKATSKNKRKLPAVEKLYKCRACKCRGTAQDFVIPDICSVACLKTIKGGYKLLEDPHEKFQYNPTFAFEYESEASNQLISEDESHSRSINYISQEPDRFCWDTYLKETNSNAAPNILFTNPYPSVKNNFKLGMKLEAIDPENASFFCVCTVVEIRGFRLKLNFDGYSNEYDFWVNADSVDIFPPGWCKRNGRTLLPPFGQTPSEFTWKAYLSKAHSLPASSYLFSHTKKLKVKMFLNL